jgi:predicted  nucleic acid-binding Zn-ribbon protein
MADSQNLLGRLADAGEEAISKVSEMPALNRLTATMTSLRERMDEMQKRLRGLDEVEKRLTALEKKVEDLAKPKRTTRPSSSNKAKSPSGSSRPSSGKSSG